MRPLISHLPQTRANIYPSLLPEGAKNNPILRRKWLMEYKTTPDGLHAGALIKIARAKRIAGHTIAEWTQITGEHRSHLYRLAQSGRLETWLQERDFL